MKLFMDAKKASDIALINAIGVIIAAFVWGPLQIVVGILAVFTGVYGIMKINEQNVASGKWKCYVAIVVGSIGILIGVMGMLILRPAKFTPIR